MATKRELILLVSMAVLFYTVQFLIVEPFTTSTTTKNNINELEVKHYTTIFTNESEIDSDSIVKQEKQKGKKKKWKKNSCVSLSSDNNHDEKEASEISLESLLQNDDGILHQVFITMPAKAAGTSLTQFTQKCMKYGNNNKDSDFSKPHSHILTRSTPTTTDFLYEKSLHKHTIITSHVLSDTPLQHLIQNMPYSTKRSSSSNSYRGSILIYVHRDETDRLISAIRHVLSYKVCLKKAQTYDKWKEKFNVKNMQLNETHCILNEEIVVESISQKDGEIGVGGNKLLTCNTYKTLKENNPLSYFDYDDNYDDDDDESIGLRRKRTRRGGVLFMDYSQADKLQKILAKYHCPGMLSSMESNNGSDSDAAIHANTAESKQIQVFVKRRDKDKEGKNNEDFSLVNLNDWLDEKRMSLEWTLNFRGGDDTTEEVSSSCQSTTKRIEENLYQCPDETMILPNSLL